MHRDLGVRPLGSGRSEKEVATLITGAVTYFLAGGGIGRVAGKSRLFSCPKSLFAVRLAIAPVPILFLLRGA